MSDFVGSLQLNESKRWELTRRDCVALELSCGAVIELNVGGAWIRTRIEHDGRGYYAVTRGLQLCAGLRARLPSDAVPSPPSFERLRSVAERAMAKGVTAQQLLNAMEMWDHESADKAAAKMEGRWHGTLQT